VTDKTQLDRIEDKLDAFAEATATNTADLKWVKRGIHGLGTILTLTLVHILRKLGVPFSE